MLTPVIASEINQLANDRQVVLLQLLGLRREAGAANVAIPLVKSPDKAVRLAALRALAEIGSGAALPVLAETLRDADRDERHRPSIRRGPSGFGEIPRL